MIFNIIEATQDHTNILFTLIKELAHYEKMEHLVFGTEQDLAKSLFQNKHAHALLVKKDETFIGFAVYFFNFSTFHAKPGLYLEDVYVQQPYRHQGIGKKIFETLAQIALKNDCMRMEWSCLNWNTPSIRFYESLGAKAMNDWTTFRLERDDIARMQLKGETYDD